MKTYFFSLVSFLVLDFIWLGIIVKDFNLHQLREIGRIENGEFKLSYVPAVLTYLLMALGVTLFVLPKISVEDSLWTTFMWGALLGFVVYGVFDMTNLAILKNYPVAFIFMDMGWGTLMFGLVSVITRVLVNKLA